MKKVFLSVCICLLLIFSANNGICENSSYSRFISPMVGGHIFEGNQGLDNGPTFGLGIGAEFDKQYGWEAVFNYTDSESDPGSADVDVITYRLDGFYNFLNDDTLVPYVAAGAGGMLFKDDDGNNKDKFMVNYGAGIKYYLDESLALRGDVRHLITFNDSYNNLLYTFGLSWFFDCGQRSKAVSCSKHTSVAYSVEPPPTPVVSVSDMDGDGVSDSLDQCPGTPAGVEVDEKGCPPDTDMDGIYDYLDDCLKTPAGATVNENGCWVIEAPLFETNQAEIKADSHATLNEVAKIIKNNPDLKLEIQGHADIRGTEEYNQVLSERRAKAVEAYFVSQGIETERMDSVGYSFTRPVAPNDTPEGMAKNRRVEISSIRIIVVE